MLIGDSQDLVFLRGHAKSGTNWVCNILNDHPDVECLGEFHFHYLYAGFKKTLGARWGLLKRKPEMFNEHFRKFLFETVKLYAESKDKKIYVDRSPIRIDKCYFPNIKYIYIKRDARDVLVSYTYHSMRFNNFKYSYIRKISKLYREDADIFEKHPELLLQNNNYVKNVVRRWAEFVKSDEIAISENPNQYYCISYEDLHQDFESIRDGMYSFLGLDISTAQSISEKATPGVKVNIPGTVMRKGKAGGYIKYLSKKQMMLIDDVLGEVGVKVQ